MKTKTIILISIFLVAGFLLAFSAQSVADQTGSPELTTFSAESCEKPFLRAVPYGATVVDHVMALYPPPACPTPPPEKTIFDPGDQVMNWNYKTGCIGGDSLRFDWYAPDGSQYYSSSTISYDGNWCNWSYFGDGIPDKPGDWYITFKYNGALMYTDYFTLTGDDDGWHSAYNKLFGDNIEHLNTLRSFRDKVLCSNPLGKTYVNRLYDRSHEVALILLTDRDLMEQARKMLDLLLPEIESALQDGFVVISGDQLGEIDLLLNNFAKKASPELRFLIKEVKAELKNENTLLPVRLQTSF